jgi:hypothetical protein
MQDEHFRRVLGGGVGGEAKPAASGPGAGFKRCLGCGGWGVGLVQDSGYCNHCTR